jgi:hypothetical protein
MSDDDGFLGLGDGAEALLVIGGLALGFWFF